MVKTPKKNLGKGLSALLGNDGKIISDSGIQKPSRNQDISSSSQWPIPDVGSGVIFGIYPLSVGCLAPE